MWGRAGYHVSPKSTSVPSHAVPSYSGREGYREGRLFLLHLVLAHTPQLSNPPGRRPLASCLTAAPWPRVWRTVPRHILSPLSGPPGIWLLDCSIVDRGMVVPQRMWSPHSALDRRRHSFRCPSFSRAKTGGLAFLLQHPPGPTVGAIFPETQII